MGKRIKEKLMEFLGPEQVTDGLIDMISYSYDASDHSHRPLAAVWPVNTEQVIRVLQLANQERFAVIPRGAGTGLAGAAVPSQGRDSVVLDLMRMNKIVGIHILDRQAIVQPGVIYAELDKELAKVGYFFPPDPASSMACTIGGNVATNAGGIRGAKYGTTRDYVLGLEVVLPSGKLMRTGSHCIKSSSGLDIARLFVGSEGVLGVITEITLKINPKPLAFHTGLAYFASLKAAGEAVAGIMSSGIVPSVMEIMDSNTLELLKNNNKMEIAQAEACILVETDGYTDAEAEFQMDKVIEVFTRCGAIEQQTTSSSEKSAKLWRIRKSISGLAASMRPNNVSEDVTVPISQVPVMLDEIAKIVREEGFPFVIFGHAGDGNLHPKVMYDKNEPDQVRRLGNVVEKVFRLTCALGGTLTGEHGIGLAKAPYMSLEHDAEAMALMRGIKRLVDPNNILNPGKMDLD
ncbi:MAG: FAD-linked oxidase C-terminal domain-containing protein [Desulfobacterales bacterium]|nr:FAD-linked oxidase C-terminal domain-containing protein [Desulfobacterales bacterium]